MGYGGVFGWDLFPDGTTLASASLDSTVLLWDAAAGQLKTILGGHTDKVLSVAFSPDGATLASSSLDGTVLLWDTATGQQKAILKGDYEVTGGIYSMAFSPDGTILASGNELGRILLWDMSPYITAPVPTAIQSSSATLPVQTVLLANYPNPFNPETWIPYQLHVPASVRLTIYDVRGAIVREIDIGYRAAGQYITSTSAAYWDGRDHRGERVASGVYLYRLQAGPVARVRKMLLVK